MYPGLHFLFLLMISKQLRVYSLWFLLTIAILGRRKACPYYRPFLLFFPYLFILFKNSSLVLVLAKRSIKSSIASTLFNSLSTLRNIQTLFRSSGLNKSSSWRVLERLISSAGYIL